MQEIIFICLKKSF